MRSKRREDRERERIESRFQVCVFAYEVTRFPFLDTRTDTYIYIYITSILSGIVETFLVKTLNSFDRLIYLIYLYYISKVSPFYSLVSRVSFSWNIISLPERNNETIILFVIIETFSIRTFFIRPFYFPSVILKSKNFISFSFSSLFIHRLDRSTLTRKRKKKERKE